MMDRGTAVGSIQLTEHSYFHLVIAHKVKHWFRLHFRIVDTELSSTSDVLAETVERRTIDWRDLGQYLWFQWVYQGVSHILL
jgi:hypothetical protein